MVRRLERGGQRRYVIDFWYMTAEGVRARYRRDAEDQTATGAQAEEQRLLAKYGAEASAAPKEKPATFADAVKLFRTTRLAALRPTTRRGYEIVLEGELVPRFATRELASLGSRDALDLDADLARGGSSPSTRRNYLIVLRSVLRVAHQGGILGRVPELPELPRVGRKAVTIPSEDVVAQMLGSLRGADQRLALALAVYAGLRAGEVRALRVGDVDLERKVLTIRRARCRGQEGVPKSGHDRTVPIAGPLLPLVEAAWRRKKDTPGAYLTAYSGTTGSPISV
jgi:integrase